MRTRIKAIQSVVSGYPIAMEGATTTPATSTFLACLTGRAKWFNHLHGYRFSTATDNSGNYFGHRKGIFPLLPPSTLRNGEVVSFTGRKGVEATKVARLDGGRVLDSLRDQGKRTTDAQPPYQWQQQADIVTICRFCTKTAYPATE